MSEQEEIEEYGDPRITSKDADIPRWLKLTYCILPILGLLGLFYYWNGSHGFLDRGYWGQLQKISNTTFPQPPKPKPNEFRYP